MTIIDIPDRALVLLQGGAGDHRTDRTSLEAAAGLFAHRAPAVEEAVREGHRAAHSGRCVFGLASRASEGRQHARGRKPAPARRLE